jgi:hemerythrin-like domain-containing protein
MDRLIEDLKKEHLELFELLEAFKKGRGVDGTGWKEKLFAARKLFQEHLKKEDEQLYPRLLSKWSGDRSMENIVQKYVEDMKKISMETMAFLDRYNTTSSGSDFMKDYAEMMIDMKSRIHDEEEKLFKELEK